MTKVDYYTAPTDEIFEEVKAKAIEIWNTYGYADEKIDRIKDIKNIRDNMMYMVAMFDIINQRKLMRLLSQEARDAINARLCDEYRIYY